ncbi:MAG: peptidase M22 [Ruminococcus sp.]|nr:peptidase M22 [Ruminococcus sp.]
MIYLGFDTSNYTTSAAIFDSVDFSVKQVKKLLPVKSGELGMRQSDAVFFHTQQLPEITEELLGKSYNIKAVSASTRPRKASDSYMPCFTVGGAAARITAAAAGIPFYETSHQIGHILAALLGAGKEHLSLLRKPFIAFHVSGGTTDCLYVEPCERDFIRCEIFSCSADLKAGQAVDRAGVMLGLSFPCGKALEALALKSDKTFRIKIKSTDGNAHFSGLQNQCEKQFEMGIPPPDIAKYCLSFIAQAVGDMTEFTLAKTSRDLPILFCGGVMSNKYIKEILTERFGSENVIFSPPEFSSDNAAGVALYGFLKSRE